MWEPFVNKPGSGRDFLSGHLLLQSVALVLPVLFIFPFRTEQLLRFPTLIYLVGTGVEFVVFFTNQILYRLGVTTRLQYLKITYLILILGGLPFSVLFAVESPYGFLASFRLIPALLILLRWNGFSRAKLYLYLFFTGSVLAMFLGKTGPGEGELVSLLYLLILTSSFLFLVSLFRKEKRDLLHKLRHRSHRAL